MTVRGESLGIFAAQTAIVGAVLGLWEIAAPAGWIDADTLPPLSVVLAASARLLQQPSFQADMLTTAAETATAFAIFAPAGLLLGFLIGENPRLYRLTRSPLDLLMATPKALLLPLFIFAFGIGFAEKVAFAIALGAFVVVLGGIAAVHSVPQGLIVAARSMGTTKAQLYWRIFLPAMTPIILASLRVGLIFAIFGVLLAEMYGATRGVGRVIYEAGEAYRLKDMLAGVLIVMLASIVISEALRQIERASLRRRGAG